MAKRKAVLFRLDPAVHDALRRWADDELRSVNAQVEFLLRSALRRAGRVPRARARGGGAAGTPDSGSDTDAADAPLSESSSPDDTP